MVRAGRNDGKRSEVPLARTKWPLYLLSERKRLTSERSERVKGQLARRGTRLADLFKISFFSFIFSISQKVDF